MLKNIKFKQLNIFRLGYIYPIEKRKKPNTFYSLVRPLCNYFFSYIYPNIEISSLEIIKVMLEQTFEENSKLIFENNEI